MCEEIRRRTRVTQKKRKEEEREKWGGENRIWCAATDVGYIGKGRRTHKHEVILRTWNLTSLLSTALLSSPALLAPLVPIVIMMIV
jgi:hypothetical protein